MPRSSEMQRRRTLIVANRTASTPSLMQEVERRAGGQPTEFARLIPDVASRRAADWTLEEALKSLRRGAAGPAGSREVRDDGLLGGADAFETVKAAPAGGRSDD